MARMHKGLFPSLPCFVQAELSQAALWIHREHMDSGRGIQGVYFLDTKVNAWSKVILPVQLPAKASCELVALGELHFSLLPFSAVSHLPCVLAPKSHIISGYFSTIDQILGEYQVQVFLADPSLPRQCHLFPWELQ